MGFAINQLAVPAVLCLIFFLSFSSQYLFLHTLPGALRKQEAIIFNALIALLLVSYYRAVLTDPGRIPVDWFSNVDGDSVVEAKVGPKPRWCRRCQAPKPPRAHHCKICERCIPKMDHHCPWTMNCVSHITFPHFIRFITYAVSAMVCLEYFLYTQIALVWDERHMPSYYGPTGWQLAHIFILMVTNTITLFMLTILWIRSVWCLVANTFTIEGWEIERHDALVRRARVLGGFLDGPDGTRVRVARQEYPYDIGLWQNAVQGMGNSNILAWFWPFSASPSMASAIKYEVNDFESPGLAWPPPDPDRMPRPERRFDPNNAFMYDPNRGHLTEMEAFRLRQLEDLKRFNQNESSLRKRQIFHKRYPNGSSNAPDDNNKATPGANEDGEEAWRNSEGERLADFGVDEEVEFYDEEDLPLAELMRRRQALKSQHLEETTHSSF